MNVVLTETQVLRTDLFVIVMIVLTVIMRVNTLLNTREDAKCFCMTFLCESSPQSLRESYYVPIFPMPQRGCVPHHTVRSHSKYAEPGFGPGGKSTKQWTIISLGCSSSQVSSQVPVGHRRYRALMPSSPGDQYRPCPHSGGCGCSGFQPPSPISGFSRWLFR